MSQEKYFIQGDGGIETNPNYNDTISNIKRLIDEKGRKQGGWQSGLALLSRNLATS